METLELLSPLIHGGWGVGNGMGRNGVQISLGTGWPMLAGARRGW